MYMCVFAQQLCCAAPAYTHTNNSSSVSPSMQRCGLPLEACHAPFGVVLHLCLPWCFVDAATVVQSLVDDGMVHQEKIGSSNYFWCVHMPTRMALSHQLVCLHITHAHTHTHTLRHDQLLLSCAAVQSDLVPLLTQHQ